jgi:hypothetical protein
MAGLCLSQTTLSAAIGDDVDTLQKFYGVGKALDTEAILFRYRDTYDVTVFLEKGRSVMEIIAHKKNLEGDIPPLTLPEAQELLASQKGAWEWLTMRLRDPAKQAWRRTDNQAFATFNEKEGLLVLMNQAQQLSSQKSPGS